MDICIATVKSSMEIPQKIKNVPTFKPSSPNSGNISEGTQNTNSKEYKHLYIHCNIIYDSHDLEAAQVSISRRVDKTTVVHIHSGILLSCKKEENFILCDSMDRPGETSIILLTNVIPIYIIFFKSWKYYLQKAI